MARSQGGKKASKAPATIIDATLAKKAERCTFVGPKSRKQCAALAQQGGDRCAKHPKGGRAVTHGLYSKVLQDSPKLTEITAAINKAGEFANLEHDIVLLRALTVRYLEANAQRLEAGDAGAIQMAQDLVNRTSVLIERMQGRKYVVTVTGINVIVQQVIGVLQNHLSSQPALMQTIATDLQQIKLPQGSLSK